MLPYGCSSRTAKQSRHQAAGFHGFGRAVQPHREPAPADHPALGPAVALDPPLLRERAQQRVRGPHLRAGPLESRGAHISVHDQQATGAERPGDPVHDLFQMAEVMQGAQREHNVVLAVVLAQGLAGVGHAEVQHIVQTRCFGFPGGALGRFGGDAHAGDPRKHAQPGPLDLPVTRTAAQGQRTQPRPAGQPATGRMLSEREPPAAERVPAAAARGNVIPLTCPAACPGAAQWARIGSSPRLRSLPAI